MSTSDSLSKTAYRQITKVNDAYLDGIHALDPSDSTQSSPRPMGRIGTPAGLTYSTARGVDLAEAESAPPLGGGGGAGGGAEDNIR